MVEVRPDRYLPGPDLWLDPHKPRPRAFVSHAHSDHIGAHGWTLCTPCTARLMAARLRMRGEVFTAEFGCRTDLGGGWFAELVPAGHVAGSAQLFLDGPEGSLLYTGDFKTRPSLSCEAHEFRRAETLVTECTFGLPRYVFPPTESVRSQISSFCRETLGAGGVPVLLAYSLGKAQELACIAAQAGLPVTAHPAVITMSTICAEFFPAVPVPTRLDPSTCPGKVVIVPPAAARSQSLLEIPGVRFATATGWAVDPRTTRQTAFPLSDHAGYDDLLHSVEQTAPSRIFTVHGFAREFAADLRRRGRDARALGRDEQLEFPGLVPP